MTSQYRTIAGVKYERDLLEFADERASKTGGRLRKDAAETLWTKAMDGGRVTATELRTLRHIMSSHRLDKAAQDLLEARLAEHGGEAPSSVALKRKRSSQYYAQAEGVRYDRALLEEANRLARQGAITLEGATELWASAHDGRGVTETELRTLRLVLQEHRLTAEAQQLLRRVLKMGPGEVLRLPVPQDNLLMPAASSEPPAIGGGQEGVPLMLSATTGPPAAGGGQTGSPAGSGWLTSLLPASPISAVRRWLSGSDKSKQDEDPQRLAIEGNPAKRRAVEAGCATVSGPTGAACGSDGRSSGPACSGQDGTSSPPGLDTLSPELRQMLDEHFSGGNHSKPHALEWPAAPAAKEDELIKQREKVAAEVERIIACRKAVDILGGGSKEEQMQQFKRIALLLHPDKGLVSKDDSRAALAMQLALVALHKARRGG